MLLFMLVLACADPTKDKVEATIEEPTEATAEAEEAPSGEAWTVDPARSELKVIGAKVTAEHPIVFHEYEGTVNVDEDALTGIAFTAEVASLEADHPKLTRHLKDEDFLFVEKYPQATFQSTAIKEGSDAEGATHTVTGDLTVRGQTKRLTFPATVTVDGDTVTANTEFAIDRQDFAVTYPGRPDDLVQDKVLMSIRFTASKPSA